MYIANLERHVDCGYDVCNQQNLYCEELVHMHTTHQNTSMRLLSIVCNCTHREVALCINCRS